MHKISCIIVEDEPLALTKTRNFVQRMPGLELLASFENAVEALTFLKSNRVDLAFVDIKMDEMSGLDLITAAGKQSRYILTTAYNEFALEGYEHGVIDYLLKPFSFERFVQSVNRAEEFFGFEQNSLENLIFIKSEHRLVKIDLNEVLYVEGMRDYRRFFLPEQKIMTLETFKELEKRVSPSLLCRVHKSFMVGIQSIDSIENRRVKIGEKYIPISDSYSEHFFSVLK